jgi:HEAT repeat protein
VLLIWLLSMFAATTSTYAQESELLSRLVQSSAGASDAALKAFTEGRDLVAEEKWAGAASRFSRFIADYPSDKNVDAAYYWLAFAYKKQNKFREADNALGRLITSYPNSSWAKEGRKLRVEMAAALDPQIAENAAKEADIEIKIIALQSICQSEQQRCTSLVGDVLKSGSRAPLGLKEASITLLGRYGGSDALPLLIQMSRSEPDEKLRVKAIAALGRYEDESVLEPLREQAMRNQFADYDPVDTALHALAQHDSPRAVQIMGQVAVSSPNIEARKHAVYLLAQRKGEEVVDELFRIYDADQNIELRKKVLEGLGNRKSPRAIARLADIARSGAAVELRAQAIRAIPHRNDEQDLDILLPLYDAERDDELKDFILEAIGQYQNRRASQKLMEIVRSNAPVERRKKAIQNLSRSKDPEVLRFLEDILR